MRNWKPPSPLPGPIETARTVIRPFEKGDGPKLHDAVCASRELEEVGYWLRGDRHGEGLCTEAVGAFLTTGFGAQTNGGWGFRRIILLCAAENIASWRVAEKLGMRLERRERAERYERAPSLHTRDSLGFVVLADEWDFEAQRAKPGIAWPP